MCVILWCQYNQEWISYCRVLNAEIGPEQRHMTLAIVIITLATTTRGDLTRTAVPSLDNLSTFENVENSAKFLCILNERSKPEQGQLFGLIN